MNFFFLAPTYLLVSMPYIAISLSTLSDTKLVQYVSSRNIADEERMGGIKGAVICREI